MIPIHEIHKSSEQTGQDAKFPPDNLCYLAGSNGLFKQVRNRFYDARVKVDGAHHLAEISELAALKVPKLPLTLLRQAEAFFVAVYRKHQSEAIVLLLVNPDTNEWRVEVPPQIAQGLHVRYDLSRLPGPPKDFELFGTIHSHANIPAFHSGTDDADEVGFDGLHITIGNVDKPVRSYASRWMLAGHEFRAELEDVLESPICEAADPRWLEQVRQEHVRFDEEQTWLDSKLFGSDSFYDGRPAESGPESGFSSVEDYEQYLWTMRDEIDERLVDIGICPD